MVPELRRMRRVLWRQAFWQIGVGLSRVFVGTLGSVIPIFVAYLSGVKDATIPVAVRAVSGLEPAAVWRGDA